MAYTNLYNKAVSEGTNYQTGDLLQDIDTNFGQAYNNTDNTYTSVFANSNLISGVLTVTHGLSTGYPKPTMRRPDGTYENALDIMTYITDNQVSFDFSGAITTGNWYLEIKK